MTSRMKLVLVSLKKSIEALRHSLEAFSSPEMATLSPPMKEAVKSGVIQNFEVAYEQSWKMMKRWLENNLGPTQVDGVTRKELFRLAAEHLLIKDVEVWSDFHRARNETSHTYDGKIAEDVLESARPFLGEAQSLLSQLETHND